MGDNKTVFIIFNKYDLFIEKIKNKPITIAFPDYPKKANPINAEHVIEFVMDKFKECLAQRKGLKLNNLYFHKTSALNQDNMRHIHGNIMLDLMKKNLKHAGLF